MDCKPWIRSVGPVHPSEEPMKSTKVANHAYWRYG